MSARIVLQCVRCCAEFSVWPHELRNGRRFCSKNCAYGARLGEAGKIDRLRSRFLRRVNAAGPVLRQELGPCHVWTGLRDRYGYAQMYACGRRRPATHVAIYLVRGHWPSACALHKCDGGPIGCVREDHLFEGTKADNTADMLAKGRAWKGREVGTGPKKLDADRVREIRRLLGGGVTHRAIAAQMGIDRTTVSQVARGRTWRHVI